MTTTSAAETAARSTGQRVTGTLGTYLAFAVFLVVLLLPVYWILLSSLLPQSQLLSVPPTYFSTDLTLDNYQRALQQIPLTVYLRNSVVFSLGSAALSVATSFLAAYAFARLTFRWSNVLLLFFLLSMALPQISTTIPLFQLFQKLHLVNTLYGLILLQGSLMVPFTIWTLISFIRQVPNELEEAARIDGANRLRAIWAILVPLMLPALGTMFVINFIITWNELFYPLVFATQTSTQPMTIGLLQLNQQNAGTGAARPWDLISALSAVMVIPIVLLVIVAQRSIVEGLTRGAGK
jgi:ABC-type glycerol-3-phosphate transport system permease component